MILRRLATSIRKQDWFAVVIETLIVVFGVFIGLQVNNWNAGRLERVDAQNVLERLERDFEFQLTLTNRGIDQQVLLLEATSRLITAIHSGEFAEQTLFEDVTLVDSVSTLPGPSARRGRRCSRPSRVSPGCSPSTTAPGGGRTSFGLSAHSVRPCYSTTLRGPYVGRL